MLVESLGFLLVPFTTLIAFTLMGIESIASELEQPCGIDASDLPLDLIAAELRNEVRPLRQWRVVLRGNAGLKPL